MSANNTGIYLTKGTIITVDGETLGGVTSTDNFGGGTASEIDISNQGSSSAEFAVGLSDGGTTTVSGVGQPQTTAVQNLQKRNKDGLAVSVVIAVGSIPANKDYTDGSGIELKTIATANSAVTSAVTGGFWTVTIADKNQSGAVEIGDYITAGSNSYKVTGVAETSTASVLTTAQTSAVNLPASIKIVRPAVKWSFNARVSEINFSTSTNDVLRFTASFRKTGDTIQTVGTPSITL